MTRYIIDFTEGANCYTKGSYAVIHKIYTSPYKWKKADARAFLKKHGHAMSPKFASYTDTKQKAMDYASAMYVPNDKIICINC